MQKGVTRRAGEFVRFKELPGGAVELEVRADMLPQPSDAYFADYLDVTESQRTCTFAFGKRSSGAPGLRTRLEVHMPLAVMSNTARTMRSGFLEKLREYVKRTGLSMPSLVGGGLPPTKEHSVAASLVVMGHADADAALSFYRIPPTTVVKSERDLDKLTLEPVVRVDTLTPVLLVFCEAVEKFATIAATSDLGT